MLTETERTHYAAILRAFVLAFEGIKAASVSRENQAVWMEIYQAYQDLLHYGKDLGAVA